LEQEQRIGGDEEEEEEEEAQKQKTVEQKLGSG
jgi:hypothetical protein